MNVLLVGLGRWGEKHLRVLSDLGVTVWASDVAPERRAVAAKNGLDPARIVSDFASALSRVDAVDIVTPADTHLELTTRCLRDGKDCFVEKPLTLTAREARQLVEVVGATGRVLQVGHIFRFHPVSDVLRRCLAEGRIGRVRYLTGRFAGFKRPRTDVGVTQTDAIHYFDLFAHLLGRAPTAVTATLRDYLGRGLDDLSFATVEYGDVPAFVEAGYFVPGTYRDCLVVGERGSLVADFGRSVVTVFGQQHQRRDGQWAALEGEREEIKAEGTEPLRRELEEFLESVAGRRRPSVSVEDGLRALQVVEAAQLSSRLGRRVTLDEVP
ncbi:MAG: Gfo/Idh/MocA family oxidoreductase [Candidatus Rokubacteria bacterium]|nr:Gfo/Idh/MocA family oxidoreductase [Candidatus Rokubacteria bacterium]